MKDMYKLSKKELYEKYEVADCNCPLCKKNTMLRDTYYEEDGRWVEEEYFYCSNCGFYHAWCLGNVEERAIYKRYKGFKRFVHDEELNKEFLEMYGELKFSQEEQQKEQEEYAKEVKKLTAKEWWDRC